ncbi:hypothetical protein [Mycetocola sp. JXN-3]|uniref:hypothetical protein n=1 Tax=Mycetocola sp. JXN-3 TaxID=2116510 RepID=UPI00165CEFB2|nr:hypothetical protein [Mycetocola sp. JXN-3]
MDENANSPQKNRLEERAKRQALLATDARLVEKSSRLSRFYLRWSIAFLIASVLYAVIAMIVVPWGTTIQVHARGDRVLNVPIFTALIFPALIATFVRSAKRDVRQKVISTDAGWMGTHIVSNLILALIILGEIYWIGGFFAAANSSG